MISGCGIFFSEFRTWLELLWGGKEFGGEFDLLLSELVPTNGGGLGWWKRLEMWE